MSAAPIRFEHASFSWPDGTPVLSDVTTTIGQGRTGLIGANGSGKTTLLRLITGELRPTSGRVGVSGPVAVLPQHLTLRTGDRVADLLGVAPILAALRAVEAGSLNQADHDLVGDHWDIEARAGALLARVGLDRLGLDRVVGAMSGGEAMLVALTGVRLREAPVTLLDEPTNNLDRGHRARLTDLVVDWPGTLLMVSHDTGLLDHLDATAELHHTGLSVFGGGYSAYRDWLATEQEAAQRALRTTEQRLAIEQRQRTDAETRVARRRRYGQTAFENKRAPKIIMNLRRREAEVSAGKLRNEADDRVEQARAQVDGAAERVREDRAVRIDLPDPGVHARRRLVTFHAGQTGGQEWTVAGPERVALTGPNGAGKTRLLATLFDPPPAPVGADAPHRVTGDHPAPRGHRADRGSENDDPFRVDGRPWVEDRPWAEAHTRHVGYLAQRLDGLDDGRSPLEALADTAPAASPNRLRAALARFLLRGDSVDRPVGQLSGGERFRVALARLLLADPPAQLLILDEPTNNLDLDSVEALVSALDGYRGALLVVSHDEDLLRRLHPTRHLTVNAHGRLDERPVPADGLRFD